jgi:hypothetical protein
MVCETDVVFLGFSSVFGTCLGRHCNMLFNVPVRDLLTKSLDNHVNFIIYPLYIEAFHSHHVKLVADGGPRHCLGSNQR